LVINNAGYNPKDSADKEYFMSTFKIERFSGDNVAKSLHINALAPTELTSQLLPYLADDAAVLNISSWLGSIGAKTRGGHYAYAGSKALLNMFTKAMALEFAEGKRVAVALNPGWMRTDMGGARGQNLPEDVAQRILELYETRALHDANGAFLNIDGSHHAW
jgi:NAD(P)-dependent dehydrogenase (short-subunit alcohol dehydrogenase family)